MVDSHTPLHQGDNIVLTDNFDFSQSIFDLEEPNFPSLSDDFLTPSNVINKKFKDHDNLVKFGHVNARSIPKHLHEIDKIMNETNFDILGTCETFISSNTPKTSFEIPGYNFFHVDRDMTCRGGVGCYVRSEYPARRIKLPLDLVQPEMIFVEITVGAIKMVVGIIYKSPLIPYTVFAAIHENIAFITAKYEHCIILGDMNIDHLKVDSSPLKFFNSYFTEPFAFSQIVDEPTRITKSSSTLIDLILTGNTENVKVHGVVDTPGISDHCLTFMAYSLKKPKFKPKMVTRRDFRNFDEKKF